MDISTDIKIGMVIHNGKERECYVPIINGVSVLSEASYILKDSINDFTGSKTDNYHIAEIFLNKGVEELNNYMSIKTKYKL